MLFFINGQLFDSLFDCVFDRLALLEFGLHVVKSLGTAHIVNLLFKQGDILFLLVDLLVY